MDAEQSRSSTSSHSSRSSKSPVPSTSPVPTSPASAPTVGVPPSSATPFLTSNPYINQIALARYKEISARMRHRRRIAWVIICTLLLVALSFPARSLQKDLNAPGTDSTAARVAGWVRDHGGGSLINRAEAAKLRIFPPRKGGAPDARLVQGAGNQQRVVEEKWEKLYPDECPVAGGALYMPTTGVLPPAEPALPHEGCYSTLVKKNNRPILRTAFVRPDSVHTSYLTGVAWMSGRALQFQLRPGTDEPGKGPWTLKSFLPPEERAGLVATFNSGFKVVDARGGYYQDTRTVGTLRDGAASFVTYTDRPPQLGQWGRDVVMSPDIQTVRQNLVLIVDGGQLVSGITQNVGGKWGATVGNAAVVWRSGIGITANGDVLYAAGDALSAETLANVLKNAGAVRAMELDINKDWTSFMSYSQDSPDPTPTNLLPSMSRSASRYFTTSQRDFYAVYLRK